MNRWTGKVAVVTGASAGIGAAIVLDLARAGIITVGLARRPEKIEELKTQLPDEFKNNLHALKCDVSKESEIVSVFKEIEQKFGGVDILVNNAGVLKTTMLTTPGNSQAIQDVINTNVMGLIFCTREAVQSMKKREFDGHVIHINSVVGHSIPFMAVNGMAPEANIYISSKFAVTAIAETHRQEFIHYGTKIKVTSISPGMVETGFRGGNDHASIPMLKSEDVSSAVLYVLGTPPHVQVHELVLKPVGEMF